MTAYSKAESGFEHGDIAITESILSQIFSMPNANNWDMRN